MTKFLEFKNSCFLFRHFQKPGTPYTMVDVADWAKRPFKGENLFVVGEAFHPFRGWSEGSLVSSDNALLEGWEIQPDTTSRLLKGAARAQRGFDGRLSRNPNKPIGRP